MSDTDARGVTTTATALFDLDGGTAVSYSTVQVGTSVVVNTPTLISPEGGDQFAFVGASGPATSEAGTYGSATIDASSGVITYTPSAAPGTAGADAFTVSDTDALGVTTSTIATFAVDGGTDLSYPTAVVATGSFTDTPTLASPEGGDSFAFVLPNGGGLASAETQPFGFAAIDPTTGVIAFTSTASPGTAGDNVFTVLDTDALGVMTATNAIIAVDGGSTVSYADITDGGTSPVTDTPTVSSPVGGDAFSFVNGSGALVATETDAFAGTASISATSGVVSYTNPSIVPGEAEQASFTVSDTDALGVTTATTANILIDGGTAVSYAPATVGTSAVVDTPTLVSPEGGDSFAFAGGTGPSEAGTYGSATIDGSTGAITYTPSAAPAPGALGTDTFSVSDTDASGVTTTASAVFDIDGGTAASYAPTTVGTSAVVETPRLVSPEGGDIFAFVGATGPSEAGPYGSATIDGSTGAITYTPSAGAGTVATDTFTVSDTDALGVTTTTTAVFDVNVPAGTATPYTWDTGSGTWNAASAGDWNPPGNGTTPTSSADVTIGSGDGGTVTLGQNQTIDNLSVTSGYSLNANGYAITTSADASVASGAAVNLQDMTVGGDLTIDGDATFTGALTTFGTITTNTGGVLALAGGALHGATIAGAGVFETDAGSSATLDGLTISLGTIYAASNNAITNIEGVIANSGTIDLFGGNGQNGQLNLTAAVTLNGGGAFVMSEAPGGGGAYFEGNGQTLTNVDDAIEGTGVFGNGSLALINSGTIDAAPEGGSSTLTLDNTGGIINADGTAGGLLEATGGATLSIDGITVDDAYGAIAVGDGYSVVQLLNATVQGGTLNNGAGGTIETAGNSTLDGSTAAGALTIDGVYTASDNTTTNIAGAIVDNGTIDLFGGNGQTGQLNLTAAVTLDGGGAVVMSDAAGGGAAYFEGNGQTLTNVDNAIEGTGVVGNGSLSIVNESTIDADSSAGVGELVLNGSGGITNTGTLEATDGGALQISGITVSNAGGEITVGDGSSVVQLLNATIQGGTLNNAAGGTMETAGNSILDGSTAAGALTIDGVYTASDNTTTNIAGAIVDNGTIDLFGGNGQTGQLNLTAAVTLDGGGAVVMSDAAGGGAAYFEGNGQTLTNVDVTIEGTGVVGNGSLSIVNESTIDADSPAGVGELVLNGSGGITNTGTLEATDGGALQISGITVTNAGGEITVGDGSSVVQLLNATIQGGTLNNGAGGTMETAGNSILDGSTAAGALTIDGVYTASDNTTTNIAGAIVDNGTIDLFGGNGQTGQLNLTAAVTLSGGGAVVMSDAAGGGAAYFEGNGQTLTNVDVTIEGTGVVGNGSLSIVNESTIDADSPAGLGELVLNGSGGITNTGTLEATDGGALQISGITVSNAGGEITVGDGSSVVQLLNTTIQGGTLNNAAGGTMETAGNSTLDGSTAAGALTIDGVYTASDNTTTNIAGAIVDNGTIDLFGGNGQTGQLNLTAAVTLDGGGAVVMSDAAGGGAAYFEGNGQTLTNVDVTIEGTGVVGNGSLSIVNESTIDADSSAGVGELVLNGSGGITNEATLEATDGGTLQISGITVSNADGEITADDGVVQVYDSTIEGGTLTTADGGAMETLGNSTLNGTTISLGSIYTSGDNATTNIKGAIVDDGTIELFGGDGQNGQLNLTGAVTLSGGGVVVMSEAPGGGAAYFEGNGQTLTNFGDTIEGTGVFGNGSLALVNSGTIDATPEGGATTLTLNNTGGIINAGGLLDATGGATLSIDGITVDNGSGEIEVGDPSSAVQVLNATIQGGTLNNSAGGTIETAGNSTLDGSTAAGALTIDGVYTASDDTTTNIRGAIANAGAIDLFGGDGQNGQLNLTAAVTLSGGGAVVMSEAAGGGGAYFEGNGQTLTNVDNAIEGTGVVGNGSLAIVNEGTIDADSSAGVGELVLNGSGGITNTGTLEATDGGWLNIQSATLSGEGGLAIGAGSKLELGVTTSETATFNGAGATLKLDTPSSYSGDISGFAADDTLDLGNMNATSATPTADGPNTTLTVALGGGGSLTYTLLGNYTNDTFHVGHSGGDSLISFAVNALTPELSAPTSATIEEGAPYDFTSVGLAETGAASDETFTVTLSDSYGHLSANAPAQGGGTIFGSGTTSLSISGTLSQVNTALSTLTDTSDSTVDDAITLNAYDSLGNNAAEQSIEITSPNTWINSAGGDWSTGANWSAGAAPGSGDNATIGIVGDPLTVTVSTNAEAADLTTAANATLDITTGSLTISGAGVSQISGPLENTGTFDIENGVVELGVGISNAGTIEVGVTSGGTLSLVDGATLSAGGASTVILGSFGTIAGGTIAASDGGPQFSGGTLDGVTYDGTLALQQSGSVFVDDGLTATGAGGSGSGTITLGDYSALYLENTQTLDNATVTLGYDASLDQYTTYAAYAANGYVSPAVTLTLGSHLTIDATGGYDTIGSSGYDGAETTVNDGTINIEASSYSLTIDPTSFVNDGVVDVADGASLTIDPTSFTNDASGTITVSSGGALTLGDSETTTLSNQGAITADDATVTFANFGVFSNSGTLTITNSTVALEGDYATAQLAPLASHGNALQIDGALNNASATLDASVFAPLTLEYNGTITGGTIVDSAGAAQFSGGTLDGVTYDGTLALQQSGSVFVDDGLTATGAGGSGSGTITLGDYSALYLENTQTLDNATVTLGYDASLDQYTTYAAYAANGYVSPAVTLTLGSHLTIDATGGYDTIGSSGYDGAETTVNDGTINIEASSYSLTIDPTSFVNDGVVDVADGASLTIDPTSFTNDASGTITVSSGGALTLGDSETTTLSNQGAITADDATVTFANFGVFSNSGTLTITNSTVALEGDYATAQLAPLASHGNALQIDGALNNASATLDASVFAPLTLEYNGTITGGTIVDSAGAAQFSGGTLDGVTYDGTLALQQSGSVYVADGLTATGAGGSGSGTITLGDYSALYLENTQTLDNATVTLGYDASLDQYTTYAAYAANGYVSPAVTLTLGSHLTIDATGGYDTIGSSGYDGAETTVNDGTINIEASSYSLTIDPTSFVNDGVVDVADGASLTIDPTSFTNDASGTITVSSGGALTLGDSETTTLSNQGAITADDATVTFANFGVFSNSGTLTITNSTVALEGDYATAQLAPLASHGNALQIDGALNNASATLDASVFAPLTLEYNGTITGGTIVDSAGAAQFSGGTLDGVTYDGTLALQQSGSVYVADGLTATGAGGSGSGTITLGDYSALYLENTQTLDNATVTLGYDASLDQYTTYAAYAANGYVSPAVTLTLGSHLTIDATGGYDTIGSSGYDGAETTVNDGTINIEASSYSLTIDPTSFVNDGVVDVADGASLTIDPTSFTNDASGTITVSSGGALTLGDSETTTLSNQGAITADDATVTFANFGVFSNSGTLTITNSTVALEGDYATAQLAPLASHGNALQIDGALNNASATLDASVFAPLTLEYNGTITGGTIVDSAGAAQFSGGTLDGVTYDGTLALQQSGSVYVADGLTATGAGGSGSGTITLGDYSALYLENTQTLDNATVTLGYDASLDQYTTYAAYAANGYVSPAVTLTLGSHLTIDATGGYDTIGSGGYDGAETIVNDGTINIEASSYSLTIDPASFVNDASGTIAVTSGGTLTLGNSNTTTLSNAGQLEADGGDILVGDALAGAGSSTVGDGGTLEFASSVAVSQAVEFTGAGTLHIDAPADFAADIAGISGSTDILDIKGFTAETTATTGAGSYDATTNLTALTLHDASDGATQTLHLVGNYSASSWTVTEDSANTGVDVVDPPAPTSSGGPAILVGSADPTVAQTLVGGPNADRLVAGAGDDILTSHGGGDTFVFKPNMGNDVITDFHAHPSSGPTDVIDLTAFHFASYQALLASATDAPAGETLGLAGHTLLLDGVHHAELHASLFLL